MGMRAVYIGRVPPIQRRRTMPPAAAQTAPGTPIEAPAIEAPPLLRTLALVGLMGAGKSAVGRRLAKALGAEFADADELIVAAAGMSIADIFDKYGEPAFRDLERRVIARVLDGPAVVLALGGGAFVDPLTREHVKRRARSVWLRADLDTLVGRTSRKKGTRPLLAQGDPRAVLAELMQRRYPIYAEADHVVDSDEQPPEAAVARIVELLRAETGETA
jgi:shikimate kinase